MGGAASATKYTSLDLSQLSSNEKEVIGQSLKVSEDWLRVMDRLYFMSYYLCL